MPTNEIAFIVLIAGVFFLIVALRGLLDWITDWLFDRAKTKPLTKDLKSAAMVAAIALTVCLLSWSFI